MIDFAGVKAITIPEGNVSKITRKSNNAVLWERAPLYTNLVKNALDIDGTVLDGVGYRINAKWHGSKLTTQSSFTAIGLMPIDGSVSHDIYMYGLNFSGTAHNVYALFSSTFSGVDAITSLKEGSSNIYIDSITKLAENYWKITTKTYSTKVKYFAISAVTVSGIVPIVTLDEPIF